MIHPHVRSYERTDGQPTRVVLSTKRAPPFLLSIIPPIQTEICNFAPNDKQPMNKQDWTYKKLGDICEVINGFAFKSEKYVDKGIRVMRITNVQKGTIVDNDPKYYPNEEAPNIRQYLLNENDLLMSLTGNVGRVGLLQKELLPAALNQRVACLRIKSNDVLLKYLFHILDSDLFEKDCIFNSSGIAQKNMSTEWLKKYTIPVPPIEEQERIVAELDLLSGIIEKKKEQLKAYDQLVQSIFYTMFGDPIDNPKGWETDILVNLVSTDCSISYGIVQPGNEIENGIPVVRPVDLVNQIVTRKGLKQIKKRISDDYKRTILKGGELLFCVRGTTGVMSFASDDLKGCNVTRGITPLSFNESINKYFAFHYLKTDGLQAMIADNTRGIALKQINMKDVRALPFLVPPLSLQQEFAEKVEAIERQKALVQQSIEETQTMFDCTMDKYFG